jgi:methylamine utilization protein MauE
VAAAARVVLVVTFVASALAKARAWRTLPDAMRAFGFSSPFDRAVAYALPVIELATAVALLAAWSSAWPAWLAVGLLGLFTVLVVRAAVRHTPCPCFGASGTTPAGPRAVLRNGVLLALAVLATAVH